MRHAHRRKGSILIVAAILVVFVFPLILLILKNASYENNFAMQERRIKANRTLVKNVATDFMRLFSQRFAETGNCLSRVGISPGNDPLLRLKDTFHQSGFTEVSVTTHTGTNSIHLRASGFQPQSGHPAEAKIKRLSANIQIANPSLRFGDVEKGDSVNWDGGGTFNMTILAPGGMKLRNGAWTWTFNNTIVCKNNLECETATPCVFNGAVYLGGTFSGNCLFNGPFIPQAPSILDVSTIDNAYYFVHNTMITTNEEWWLFGQNAGVGEMGRYNVVHIAGTPPTRGVFISSVTIPSSGAIFVSSNVPVHLEGQILGRVTVVALMTSPSIPAHFVFIENDIVYANGTNSADANHSFAILTNGIIHFAEPAGGNLVTNGYIYSSWPTLFTFSYNLSFRGFRSGTSPGTVDVPNHPASFTNYGSAYHPIWRFPSPPIPINFLDDPNLARFPPPGVPSQAFLVNLTVE